ncbi:DUF4917 family protein [Novosphingobium sp. BL-52-GroH]|uniref:DUF4917 family protein n=1 Tax=Novosphingobium sp. BL-52-GroH TaxID=3349877 RepID=UPI003850421C
MTEVLDFAEALSVSAEHTRRHLLLGNGFSIALKPDIFSYGSLFDNADFDAAPDVPELFRELGTNDFEVVIRHLQDTATVVKVYRPRLQKLIAKLLSDAEAIKDALVSAVARRHPSRPYDVTGEQYSACRTFLHNFNHIFTLNYDVLLYWALMHTDVDDLNFGADDGFRHPEDDPNQPWVTWQQGSSATVNYLHGALHLFDTGSEIRKYTWSKTDVPIVDQIRQALDRNSFPIFVAEGSSDIKLSRIMHSAYLHKATRSLESCCKGKNAIFIYGHSLADNDDHILRYIASGTAPDLFVSLYGDPNSDSNQMIIGRANGLAERRAVLTEGRKSLTIRFFDAASAQVWG